MKLSLIPACFALLVMAIPGSATTADTQGGNGWRRVDQPPVQPQVQSGSVPDELTIPPGTFITARIDQVLSSDLSEPGDAFSATLVQPVVARGVVVARPGQTVVGKIVEAQKAGRVHGVGLLGVQLCELTLVDGRQVPIQSRFVHWKGPTSTGADAAAIAGPTTLGAIIGGATEGGLGAGVGAAAGAAAGTIGVLLTRGRPAVLYPESLLTFQTEYPVTISTDNASAVFRYVTPEDYERAAEPMVVQAPARYAPPPPYYPRAYAYPYPPYPPYPAYPPYAAYPFGYPYFWGSPFSYGPGFSVFFGSGWGWGHGYYGHHGGHWHR